MKRQTISVWKPEHNAYYVLMVVKTDEGETLHAPVGMFRNMGAFNTFMNECKQSLAQAIKDEALLREARKTLTN